MVAAGIGYPADRSASRSEVAITVSEGHKDAEAAGITLRLVGVRGLMRHVLKVCGLLPILTSEGPTDHHD